jgi:hypothetical protein
MDRTGLLDSIIDSEKNIDQGRKWLDSDGTEREGRLSFRRGLTLAIDTFRMVQSMAVEDIELVILAEYMFLAQELQLCAPADTQAASSLIAYIPVCEKICRFFGNLRSQVKCNREQKGLYKTPRLV